MPKPWRQSALEEKPLQPQELERLLIQAVDEGLSSLGDSSKQAIYFHLDTTFNIKKEQIPQKVEAFVAAIEKIFGIGANFIEILIMRKLIQKRGGPKLPSGHKRKSGHSQPSSNSDGQIQEKNSDWEISQRSRSG